MTDYLLENLRGTCPFARQRGGDCRAVGESVANYCTPCAAAERIEELQCRSSAVSGAGDSGGTVSRDARSVAVATARAWLARQVVVDGREPMLDEGDCRLCGHPAGEGHEPTDPCGIVANLLLDLEGPAGGARVCTQAEPRTTQSTGTSPDDIHRRCRATAERFEALAGSTRVDAPVSGDLLLEAASLLRGYGQVVLLEALAYRQRIEETHDSVLLAVNADRAAIADFLLSCREGGNMTNAVQVFDVLAKKIRNGEHLPPLPEARNAKG